MSNLNHLKSLGISLCLLFAICGCGTGSNTNTSGTGSLTKTGTGNFQLTVQVSGPGTVTSAPAGINCGQTCSASFAGGTSLKLTATPASDSTFSGWSGGCTGTGACTVDLSAATSVTATFTAVASPVQLTVKDSGTGTGTVTSNPAGINCGKTCSANFNSGTSVTLTAAPADGSTFTGWSGPCQGTGTCTVDLTTATSVTAQFTAAASSVQLTVQDGGPGTGTITSSPAGINCGSTCAANFPSGTSVTLTATPGAGSTFTGWSGGCKGNDSCTFQLSKPTSVTATFAAGPPPVQLTVQDAGSGSGTVTSNPAGINCGSACTASFQSGTSVTLTATPASGSTFTGWSGACSGSGNCTVNLTTASSVTATFAASVQLTVQTSGDGTGTITSSPSGINCGSTCTATFPSGTSVLLTTDAQAGSTFGSWSGGCSGSGGCNLKLTADTTVTATFNSASGIDSINHIILLVQENRSLDSYFGALRQYWRDNGYTDISFDGLPQFNPTSGDAPLYGPPPAIPGCDPASPAPGPCNWDPNNLVQSFHLNTMCTENTSPSWDPAHVDWDYNDQLGKYPAKNNGFVWTAGHDARNINPPFNDTDGIRAMGYYDGSDLNYYYFMASNFATSDRWFNPAMSRTNINREYILAATSQGYAYPNGSNANDTALLTAKTIFQELQENGISWRIYVDPQGTNCSGPPYDATCLMQHSYLQNFVWGATAAQDYPQNFAPISQYLTDVQNGTLAQVSYIANPYGAGLDEHGSDSDAYPINIQLGAQYIAKIINALMQSPSWPDSALFFTYDEAGGLYDHVPPQPTVSPDGIKPVDLEPGDPCTNGTGPTCDFTYTGYRIPLIVVSPYAKQHYVSHTVADSTAMLKFIETRFGLPPLTKRDAAQMDMTEFFDFNSPPWMNPPTPPVQNTSGACYLDHLP
jgi:phospholipase C